MMKRWLTMLFLAIHAGLFATEFRPIEKITDGAYPYHLSRNSSTAMDFDSEGTLHATYWSGGLDTRPDAQSRIFHQAWHPSSGWNAQQVIDDSFITGIGRIGGRHPSLAITPDDAVWIAWSDHRHCTDAGNWMNNTEIYADVMPAGGSFSSSDIRLTNTAAGTMGDNGYTPKLVRDANGKLHLAWHDYSLNVAISDIYLTPTGLDNLLSFPTAFSSLRATNTVGQGGPEYTVVDMAIAPDGTRHLVWCGGQGAGVDLYYGAAAEGTNAMTEQILAANAADYFDPPHVAVSASGDVWVAWGDETAAAEDVRLLRKRQGQTSFDAPITIASHPARQYAPTLAIDAQDRVHLAWVDEQAGRHILYAIYDPATSQLSPPVQITDRSASWTRPSLLLNAEGEIFLLIEETISMNAGDIWFATTASAPAKARQWMDYE